jgi:hypothetical protein
LSAIDFGRLVEVQFTSSPNVIKPATNVVFRPSN